MIIFQRPTMLDMVLCIHPLYDTYTSEAPISKRRSRPLQRRTPGHFAPEID